MPRRRRAAGWTAGRGKPAPPAEPAEPAAAPASGPAEPAATASGTAGPIKPVEGARNIKVGDVLNHIFEVKRFLARGGMGEVFEGCNVNTDERVAIKVMLPAMAADEKVVGLFRKEARTLTKLQHEALVSYRVLAQEPQLGVLYIVTEFIEGVELGEMLGKVERTPEELAGLLKRLASGLPPPTGSARSTATCRPTTCCFPAATSTRPRSSTSASPRTSTPARRRSSATASPAS